MNKLSIGMRIMAIPALAGLIVGCPSKARDTATPADSGSETDSPSDTDSGGDSDTSADDSDTAVDDTAADDTAADDTAVDDTAVDDTGEDTGTVEPDCPLVTMSFRAELVTIAGTPFGLTYDDDAGRMASGTFTYDLCVPDTDPFGSPDNGEYDHVYTERGAFAFTLDTDGTPLEILGSTRPMVGIRGLDYFDFEDGGFDVFASVERYVTVNGALDYDAEFDFLIGAGKTDFATDELPEEFPMTGTSADSFDCLTPADYCVTFSIAESTFGDSFLMQLHELTQVSESPE